MKSNSTSNNYKFEALSKIPKHWKVKKLKYVSKVQLSNVDKHTVEGETPVRLCNYVDVYKNDFITNDIEFMKATASKNEIRKFEVSPGDVLLTKDSETWDDIAVPAYVTEKLDNVICGYHLAQVKTNKKEFNSKYLFRCLGANGINDQYQIETTGVTRFGLGKYYIDNSLLPVPPIDEQNAIIDFLYIETTRIDNLIEKKKRQIKLLQEKRTILISHVVTKGLNPDAKMKDSGIDWLGRIPAHWKAIRLKYVSSINDETISESTDPDYEIAYIDISSINKTHGIQKKELLRFKEAPSRARRKVKHGDVIVSTVRTYLRAIAPIIEPETNLIVSTGFAVIRPRKRFNSKFAAHMLKAQNFVDAVVAHSVGISYPAINASEIGVLFITIPPLLEQQEIAEHLDLETRKIDSIISKVDDSIEKLHEYRTSLISAAVTGKIDVKDRR